MLVVECGEEHRAEREYILAVLLGEFLGLEFEIRWRAGAEVVISSTDAGDHRRVRVADVLFASSESLLDPGALPRTPLQRCPAGAAPGALLLGEIPVIYGKELAGGGYVAHDGDEVRLGVDVFGGAFAQLSLLEEAVSAERDAHDRFPAEASLAVREGFAARPVVDECVELLWWGLSRLWPRLSRRSHAFVVRPTHDVDWPFYSRGRPIESVRDAVRDTVVRHDRSLARARISALFAVLRAGRNADPCNTFDFLMAESESRGLTSAFYFIAGRTDRARDPGYPLDDVWIRSLLRRIDEHGHEIGLHPSYGTLEDFKTFLTAAHNRGIRVIIEMVMNHTSDKHKWFLDSKSSRTANYRDWYVWRDPKPDGSPPNNWKSVFGGGAWTLDPRAARRRAPAGAAPAAWAGGAHRRGADRAPVGLGHGRAIRG